MSEDQPQQRSRGRLGLRAALVSLVAAPALLIASAAPALAALATPALNTVPSAGTSVGGTISDSASVTGGNSPTGTVDFMLYGPGDPNCAGSVAWDSGPQALSGVSATSGPFTTTAAGTYQWVAHYSGDVNNNPVDGACPDPTEKVVVTKVTPSVSTLTSSGTSTVGGSVTDTATVSGGFNPTGTVSFSMYPPSDSSCTGTPVAMDGPDGLSGGVATSGPFSFAQAGTYHFIATYSGDTNNAATSSLCADEPVAVSKATSTISTQTSWGSLAAGQPNFDTASLGGAPGTQTGTITFTAFGPGNATCTGAPKFSSTVPVSGNGNYDSATFTPTQTGSYSWIAVYSGDSNYVPVSTGCNDTNETFTVTQASPTLSSQTSAPVTIGGAIHDVGTLVSSNGDATGTMTFDVYGPADANCTGPVAFTSTNPVSGTTATSTAFTPATAGLYHYRVTYTSGDANNANVATTACNASNENVMVNQAATSITSSTATDAVSGAVFHDTAVLAGGVSPTGTISYRLFNNSWCSGSPVATVSTTVTGNGSYQSPDVTQDTVGLYYWRVIYNGDTNNAASALTACGAANERSTVSKITTNLVTTANGPVTIGSPINDSAVLSGGNAPGGTITFDIFGPNNPSCNGSPVTTLTTGVTGNGTYGSGNWTPTVPGVYEFVDTYSGDGNNFGSNTVCGTTSEQVTVNQVVTTLLTAASPPTGIGGAISDNPVLSGGASPTGTITVRVYGPNDNHCDNEPVKVFDPITVNGNGGYPTPTFTPTTYGTYYFTASYSGDVNNAASSSACGAAGESVVVSPVTPTLATLASPATTAGQVISDVATITGGLQPGGTLTFRAYTNSDCDGSATFTSDPITVDGNGSYLSGDFTTTAAGTYSWQATYSGDGQNAPVTGGCGGDTETTTVGPATPTITGAAQPASVLLGNAEADSATLNGVSPTGTILFVAFGAGDTTCANPAVFTSTIPVSGNGSYTAASFAPGALGTYRWVARYSGDANNNAVSTACSAPAQRFVVHNAAPPCNVFPVLTVLDPQVAYGSPARVRLTGQPGDSVTIDGFSAPDTSYHQVRNPLTIPGSGVLDYSFLPPSTTHVRAVSTLCGDSAPATLLVRSSLIINSATKTAHFAYTFTASTLPTAASEGRAVTLFVVTPAGNLPKANGTFHNGSVTLSAHFTVVGTFNFFVHTNDDASNLASNSPNRSVAIS